MRLDAQLTLVQLDIQGGVMYLHRRKKQAEVTPILSLASGHYVELLVGRRSLTTQSRRSKGGQSADSPNGLVQKRLLRGYWVRIHASQ